MISWKIASQSGIRLATVLNCKKGLEQTKIISKLYNGSYNVQTVGNAAEYLDIEVYAPSVASKEAIDEAEANNSILYVYYKDSVYVGFLKEPLDWEAKIIGKSYVAKAVFLIEGA